MNEHRVDGRHVRRERNREAVINAAIELIEGGDPAPTTGNVAQLAGVSHRSVFRYFDDVEQLFWTAIRRALARHEQALVIHGYRSGSLDERIDALIDQRCVLFAEIGPVATAVRMRQSRAQVVAELFGTAPEPLRRQIDEHFERELRAMDQGTADAVGTALELLLSFDAYETMVEGQGRGEAEVRATYRYGMQRLLSA